MTLSADNRPEFFLYTRRFQTASSRLNSGVSSMKAEIHPQYQQVDVHCACGESWKTGSTKKELRVDHHEVQVPQDASAPRFRRPHPIPHPRHPRAELFSDRVVRCEGR